MFSLIQKGGPGMNLFVIITIVIFALTVKKVMDLYVKKDLEKSQMEYGVNAILFWGVISGILGFYFHYTGMYLAFGAISRATDISPAVVAAGYQISLITVLTGLVILLFSSCIWFIFRYRVKQLS